MTIAYGHSSLVDLLRTRFQQDSGRPACVFLRDGEEEETRWTRGELDARARSVAARLQRRDGRGERVLLLFPPGLDFVAAFLGCLYAGAVAVPAYPPRSGREQPRLRSIVGDARPRFVLTTSAIAAKLADLMDGMPALAGLEVLVAGDLPAGDGESWAEPDLDPATLAFLQYTSGSTAEPKGVMVSHGNLLHNFEVIRTACGHSEGSTFVSWLPIYHDMGLMGGVLQPLVLGALCVLMSPAAFLQRPARWLRAVSRYRAHTSGGPDFAYDLCVRKIPLEQRADLDLSSWQVAFDGSEPVRAATLESFAGAFAPCGFRSEAFFPCYGLAEATLIVSGERRPAPPVAVERTAEGTGRPLVGCGPAGLGQEVVIVDPEALTEKLPGQVGEIWVSGPNVALGYWERPEQTERTFGAHLAGRDGRAFLRTGDLGFLEDGRLFVSGRLKDLLIVRGRNQYPQDLEATVQHSHPALRGGTGAAFGLEGGTGEEVAVVHEVDVRQRPDLDEVLESARRAVAEEHEIGLAALLLVRPGGVPRTTSGKVQRQLCRERFLAGLFEPVAAWRPGEAAPEDTPPPPSGLFSAEELAGWLLDRLAARLGVPRERLEADVPLVRLGLDSMAAVELMNEIERATGAELPLAVLLESPGAGHLAQHLLGLPRVRSRSAPDVIAGEEETVFPLSPGQRGIWFEQSLDPGGAAYNIAGAARFASDLDPAALRRAFAALAERHAALRTTFETGEDGEPVQRVHPRLDPAFREEDAAGWSDETLQERLREETFRPFDLAAGPLLRVHLFHGAGGGGTLLLTVHHLVADFWSLAVLVRELGPLYAGQSPAPLSHPPGREGRLDGDLERRWSYWNDWSAWWRSVEEEPLRIELPADRPRAAPPDHRCAAWAFRLEAPVADRLRALGRERGATLFQTLLATFQTLLHGLCGRRRLLVGAPSAGRSGSALAGLVGYFVNPLPLRSETEGDPPFAAFLDRSRRTVLEAFEHEVPFPLLIERLQPEREAGRAALPQAVFALYRPPFSGQEALAAFALGEPGWRLDLGGLHLESRALATQPGQFDLTLLAAELGDEIRLSLLFDASLFDRTTAGRMAASFSALAEAIAADPERRLSGLPLLAEAERRQVLGEWNDTARHALGAGRVHERIAARAEEDPHAPAVVCGSLKMTRAELVRRARELAGSLRSMGVGPDSVVAVLGERRPETVAGLLGVLEAGGAYLPIDPALPRDRVSWLLRDSRAEVLLAGTAARSGLGPVDIPTILLEGEEAREPAAPGREVPAESLAYVIYTSGSTGLPKGVGVSHGALENLIDWHLETFGLGPAEAVSHVANLSFDASVWEVWPALAAGARVHLPDEETRSLPGALRDWLAGERIRAAFVPTAMAERLLALDPPPGAPLRLLLTGGERLGASPSGLPFELRNNYGPTENAVVATSGTVSRTPPSLGRPIANVRTYVLDAALRPLPAGCAGEIYLAGASLARGYLGQPRQTAERFLPDPFGGAGERLYRTGDRARWLPGGELDFLGRSDGQVKIRGFRIEPAEIEASLQRHAGIREAAVLAVDDPVRGGGLVAFVAGPAVPPARELRAFLREMLPPYMIPASFVEVEALPQTANGKVDRRALADRALEREPAAAAGGEMPRGPVEEVIAGLWAEALGLDRVGVEDDFFALGGHSLLASRLVSQMREVFQADLTLRRFFEASTVAGLAAAVEEALEGGGPLAAPLSRRAPEAHLPPSSAQRRLWLIDRIEPGSPAYNIPVVLRLSGRLEVSALAAALDALARRHEALRTTFPEEAGGPVQRISPAAGLPLPQIDLSSLSPSCGPVEAERLAAAEARRPFDLAAGPLWRTLLLRLGTGEHRLLWTVHHIVADGWSMGVLLRDLTVFYAGAVTGRPAALPALTVRPADVALQEEARLADGRLAARIGWWERQLAGAPLLQVPTDRPRRAERSPRGRTAVLDVPSGLAAAVAALARRERATPFAVLLAAFQAQLFRLTGEEDLTLGSAVAQRGRAELEPLAGLLLETVVLRTSVAGGLTFRELLGRSRRTVLDASRHADVPFEKVVERLRPERALGHNPLFEVSFFLEPDLPDRLDLPGLAVVARGTDTGIARFELCLSVRDASGRLTLELEHSADLFDSPTAARMLRGFVRLLSGAVAAPETRLDAVPLLDEAERFQILAEWNDVPSWSPGGLCLVEAFAAQAARTPDAPAVVCGEEVLTYAGLKDRAGRLARELLARGAGSGARVGLWAERSAATVVGILAALEAGAAYVPLDPAHPAERHAHVARDSGLAILLAPEEAPELPGLGLERLAPGGPRTAVRAAAPGPFACPDSMAYVLYTSGSTGRPKGVCCSHAGVLNVVRDLELRLPLRPGSGCSLFSSFSFDVSVLEIFGALLSGSRLEIVPDRVRADGRVLAGWLAERAIENADIPPSLLGDLARELERTRTPAPLRRLLVGLEPIHEPLLAALAGRLPGLRVFNCYGPTEATIQVTLFEIGSRPVRDRPAPIGGPIQGARIYLLDRGLEPVPAGVPGELYAAGAGLAQGYFGKPDLTAERFLPDPFGTAPGERMYRTGDLSRRLPEGDLEFLGRLDFQVKIRGIRIELGEIEAALRAHPAVAEAVVVAREAAVGGRRLAAYLVPAEGAEDRELGAGELRRHLAGRLPEVMIPATFVTLAALPSTSNGKIDRSALPEPGAGRPDLETAYSAPRTPEEQAVGAVWQAVLGQERIGIHDNFFELGGNSLLLVELEKRLREALGREVPIAEMYRNPTIHGLVQALSAQDGRAQEGPEDATPPRAVEPRAAGGVVDRQRQFLEDQKRRRAEQRRAGR